MRNVFRYFWKAWQHWNRSIANVIFNLSGKLTWFNEIYKMLLRAENILPEISLATSVEMLFHIGLLLRLRLANVFSSSLFVSSDPWKSRHVLNIVLKWCFWVWIFLANLSSMNFCAMVFWSNISSLPIVILLGKKIIALFNDLFYNTLSLFDIILCFSIKFE